MEKERLAVLEEQAKWIASKVDRIESKVDLLSEKMSLWVGKIIGAAAIVSLVITIAMEWINK